MNIEELCVKLQQKRKIYNEKDSRIYMENLKSLISAGLITFWSLGIFGNVKGQDILEGHLVADSVKYIVYNNKDFIVEKGYFNSDSINLEERTFKKKDNYYEMIDPEFKVSNELAKRIKGIIEKNFNKVFSYHSKDWTLPGEYTYKSGKLIKKNLQ